VIAEKSQVCLWWGRWDLNPGSPAPQAGILDQARLRPHTAVQRPSLADAKILQTLIKLQSLGREKATLKHVSYRLTVLTKHCSLDDPEQVNTFIATQPWSNSYKDTFVKSYSHYVKCHRLQWVKPKYKTERRIPKIPSTESINMVISRSSKKFAVVFKILMETGAMPFELSQVKLDDIDLEHGMLSIQGFKGHAGRVFKLRQETQAMLKEYLGKYTKSTEKKVFPSADMIGKRWRKFRNKLAEQLHDPLLKTIKCYDLRRYFGTMTYYKTKDILYTKQQMGHKKIETTLLYAQLVSFESDEYTSAVAKNVNEAQKLVESGFEYVTTFDSIMMFRKRK
jgi:integrase